MMLLHELALAVLALWSDGRSIFALDSVETATFEVHNLKICRFYLAYRSFRAVIQLPIYLSVTQVGNIHREIDILGGLVNAIVQRGVIVDQFAVTSDRGGGIFLVIIRIVLGARITTLFSLLTLENLLNPSEFVLDLLLDVFLIVLSQVDAMDLPVLVTHLTTFGNVNIFFPRLGLSCSNATTVIWQGWNASLFSAPNAEGFSRIGATASPLTRVSSSRI